jgi:hypothetical protein
MADSPYIAQYQATIFIGGFWVDDARGIEFQISDPKEPLFGFRDVNFSSVARGQTMVHGVLDLNFRFKGYLPLVLARLNRLGFNKRILDAAGGDLSAPVPLLGSAFGQTVGEVASTTREHIYHEEQGNDFRNANIDPRDFTSDKWKDMLEKPHQEFDIPKFTRMSDALKEVYWDDRRDMQTVADDIAAGGSRPRIGEWPNTEEIPTGFDMTIVYMHPDPSMIDNEQDAALIETIKDVHIMAQSKIIMNAVPGGGENIIERYQFIAKDVV